MSTGWNAEANGLVWPLSIVAAGFPAPEHPAEADAFARHQGVPGHDQAALDEARILIVGAGGLGSWAAVAMARSGARQITVLDPDRFDRTNGSRQLMFGADIREPKATAVARNVAPHMIGGGIITGIALPFGEAVERYAISADVVVVGVDNNACRLQAARFGIDNRVPVVFAMLSHDGMRVNTFMQAAGNAPCLWCALPNLDPGRAAPCVSAVITSCLVAAAHITFFVHRALMGWPEGTTPFNWRAADLLAGEPDVAGRISRRADCPVCGGLNAGDFACSSAPGGSDALTANA